MPVVIGTTQTQYCPVNINPRKIAGPEGVLRWVLKDKADERPEVFTTIYNTSLSTSWVPACFNAATNVPVPKSVT